MRIAIVCPSFAYHREFLFSRLSGKNSVQLKVFPLEGAVSRDAKFDSYQVQIIPFTSAPFLKKFRILQHFGFDLWRWLSEFRPDALIVYGHRLWPTHLAVLWGIISEVPVFLRTDINDIALPRGLRKWRQKLLGKFFTLNEIFALAIGTSNTVYWKQTMGFASERIFLAPYAANNEYFEKTAAIWRKAREELKTEIGIAGKKVILYAGRFVRYKDIPRLLKAYKILSERRNDIALILVGDGPLKQHFREITASEGLKNVIMPGFIKMENLPRYYAMADVFALPSVYEQWGLVVNEAMASGLPVVVSDKVGAGVDLVRDGDNGFIFPAGDETALAEAIEKVLQNPAPYGKRSREIICSWGFEEEIKGFLNAINQVRLKQ